MKFYITKEILINYVEVCSLMEELGMRSALYIDAERNPRYEAVPFITKQEIDESPIFYIRDRFIMLDLIYFNYSGYPEEYELDHYFDLSEDEVMLLKLSLP